MSGKIKIDLTEKFEVLPKAPIVEAVMEFRTQVEAQFQESQLRSHVENRVAGYEYLDSRHTVRHEFDLATKEPQRTVRDLGIQGVRFKSGDERHIVQFNYDSFVFSRLPPYESWNQFNSEAMRVWNAYVEVLRPVEVQRVGLRFINQIRLPPQELRFEDYLQWAPQPPKGLELPHHAFLHHETLAVPGHPYAVTIIRTIQPPHPPVEGAGLILDIDVFTTQGIGLDQAMLQQRLAEMRWLKNKVFFGSVTRKAIKLFKE